MPAVSPLSITFLNAFSLVNACLGFENDKLLPKAALEFQVLMRVVLSLVGSAIGLSSLSNEKCSLLVTRLLHVGIVRS